MNGDIRHRSGFALCDGFDISTELVSIKLLDIPDDSFTKVQHLGKDGCWLTRRLRHHKDSIVSLFCAEDCYFADKNILVRKINSAEDILFYIKTVNHSIFHRKYTVGKYRIPVIQAVRDKRTEFIILPGELRYDSISGHLNIPAGCHEILICGGDDPAFLLRNAAKLLECDHKSIPRERNVISNALDTVYTSIESEKNSLYIHSLKLLGIKHCPFKPEYDDASVIHGALPCKDSDDGSATDTLFYIYNKGKYADRCISLFRENFVRGDKTALNSHKRRENLRMSRFRFGLCPYCRQNTSWLEKTRHSTYACTDCYEDANCPTAIPENNEWLSDMPLLIMIYLGLDIPMFDDIPGILKKLSQTELDTEMTALLLYALCVYSLDERHTVYKKLMTKRNDIGIWAQDYCSPGINAVCCAAISKYGL